MSSGKSIYTRLLLLVLTGGWILCPEQGCSGSGIIDLPPPCLRGDVSLEEAIKTRRSRRSFQDGPLTLKQVSQILWAAQGITEEKRRFRAAPSAGALYPLELYLVVRKVEDLPPGLYHYQPDGHTLVCLGDGNYSTALARVALGQMFIAQAPACLVITAVYERTAWRYGKRAARYVHIEVGHVGQNVYLQTEALGLGTVAVGAFSDDDLADVLEIPPEHRPLCLMPIGYSP